MLNRDTRPRVTIVTGSRHAKGRYWIGAIHSMLMGRGKQPTRHIVIHGDAPGIDTLAHEAARGFPELTVIPVPAQWETFGPAAGPMRNFDMLRIAQALQNNGYTAEVIAFHNHIQASRGTKDMVIQAHQSGMPVILVNEKGQILPMPDLA